ncbi:MAG: hypothetical protein AB1333_03615 [Patescibacteria group bacterium]
MKKSIFYLKSFLCALGTFVYITVVAFLMFNGKNVFGDDSSFMIPVFMLLLLVISASITGFLVFGNPIQLYLDGHKKEAFTFLFSTISWLILFAVGVVIGFLI